MSLSHFKGFGQPHNYSKRRISRVQRLLQKDRGSEVSGSRSAQGRNGADDEQRAPALDGAARHKAEWVQGSAVDPEVAALNLASLDGQAPYEYLFYSDQIKRLNTGRLPSWILKKYAHIEDGAGGLLASIHSPERMSFGDALSLISHGSTPRKEAIRSTSIL